MSHPTVRTIGWLTLSALCLAHVAEAQGTVVSVGAGGGVSQSEINVSGNEDLNVAFTMKPNGSAGMFVAVRFQNAISFETDALVTVKGSRLVAGDRDDRFRLMYLEVPLLMRFGQWSGRKPHVNVLGGVFVARLLKTTLNGARADDGMFRSGDFGWVAGFGFTARSFQVDARYSGGIVEVAGPSRLAGFVPPPGPNETRKFRNRGFALLGAWFFK